jgi:hypothetical protein
MAYILPAERYGVTLARAITWTRTLACKPGRVQPGASLDRLPGLLSALRFSSKSTSLRDKTAQRDGRRLPPPVFALWPANDCCLAAGWGLPLCAPDLHVTFLVNVEFFAADGPGQVLRLRHGPGPHL